MNITQVSFRRKFNLGNYETMDIELVADIEPREDAKKALDRLVDTAKEWKREAVKA